MVALCCMGKNCPKNVSKYHIIDLQFHIRLHDLFHGVTRYILRQYFLIIWMTVCRLAQVALNSSRTIRDKSRSLLLNEGLTHIDTHTHTNTANYAKHNRFKRHKPHKNHGKEYGDTSRMRSTKELIRHQKLKVLRLHLVFYTACKHSFLLSAATFKGHHSASPASISPYPYHLLLSHPSSTIHPSISSMFFLSVASQTPQCSSLSNMCTSTSLKVSTGLQE